MKIVKVIYTAKAEYAEQNQRNIQAVMSDLQQQNHSGINYNACLSADEQKPANDGTVEAWGRSETSPVGGWYGLKKGLRGRFGMYIPPLMEKLGFAELTHEARGNKMRTK